MFEFLFSYPREYFEAGTLIWLSLGSWPLSALFAVAALLATLLSLWRWHSHLSLPKRLVLGTLQLSVLFLAILLLGQPLLEIEKVRPGENKVLVLVDNSLSMALADESGRSGLEQMAPLLQRDLLEALERDGIAVEVRTIGGDEHAQLADTLQPPHSFRSDIGTLVESGLQAASRQALAGLILVSDGADNVSQMDAAWFARVGAFGVPVHTVGVGREVLPNDSRIVSADMPALVTPDSRAGAQVILESGSPFTTLLKVYEGEQILASQEVSLPGGGQRISTLIDVPTGPVGVRNLRFELDPAATEYNLVNNQFRHTLTVAADYPRILYVEGEPRWEYKFIRRAIEDSGFAFLHSMLQTSPNKTYRQGIEHPDQLAGGFPSTREDLFAYRALIIGSQEAAALSAEQQQLVREFVDIRGGALLMLGGQKGLGDGGWQNTPIGDILPVEIEPNGTAGFVRRQASVKATRDGLATPWLGTGPQGSTHTWQDLPALADYHLVGAARAGAQVLLEVGLDENTAHPLLAWQRYGRGKTFVLATGGTWRWQMQMPSTDRSHEIFWQNLLGEMIEEVPGRLSIATDQNWYRDRDQIQIRARLRDEEFAPSSTATISATVTDSANRVQTLELRPAPNQPGEYRASASVTAVGQVRIDISARLGDTEFPAQRLFVTREDRLLDYFNTALDRTLLERLAQATGGRYTDMNNSADLLAEIRFSPSGIRETEWLALWSMPINFLLLLFLKLSEWLLRRRWGRL